MRRCLPLGPLGLLIAAGCTAPAITGNEETLSLESDSTGQTYDILVRTPPGYDPDDPDGYALVLQLDATMKTKALTEYRYTAGWTSEYEGSGDVPEAIVVGIGHTEEGYGVGRAVDFVPPSETEDPYFPDQGAPEFHAMLRDELLPWLEDGWAVSPDPADRVLLGHSLGGLFVVYAVLLYEPGGNDFLGNFVAFDPSVWTSGCGIFGLEEEAAHALVAGIVLSPAVLFDGRAGPVFEASFYPLTTHRALAHWHVGLGVTVRLGPDSRDRGLARHRGRVCSVALTPVAWAASG